MSWSVEALNRWGAIGSSLMGIALWQSTLVALLVAGAAVALRRASPAVRYWLWQLVAIKLLLIPLGTWSLELPWLPASETALSEINQVEQTRNPISAPTQLSGTETFVRLPPALSVKPVSQAPANAQPQKPVFASFKYRELTWQAWLLLAWATIVALQIARLLAQRRRLARLLRRTTHAEDSTVNLVAQVAQQLQLKRAPQVRMTELDCSPFVCGIWQPHLVLPKSLVAELAMGELKLVLAHELAHIRRRDLLFGWITEAARLLFFFHPVVHWSASRVRLERELACDQVALHQCGRTAAQYAETLVHVLSTVSPTSGFRTATASLDGGMPHASSSNRKDSP